MRKRARLAKVLMFVVAAVLLVGGFFSAFRSRGDNIVMADDGTLDGMVKMVTIFDDGERVLVQTRARTVRETLEAARIEVNEFDRIEPELDDIIDEDGFNINIYRAQPVLVRDGSRRVMGMSGARDPRGIALSLGFIISEYDDVYFRRLNVTEMLESGLKHEVVIERTELGSLELPEEVEEEMVEVVLEAPPRRVPVDRSFNMEGFDCIDGLNDSLNNEVCAWFFFRSRGFSAVATAGIMGNLQQEHRFRTADVPGGLGIAQWMGGRRARLLEMENPFWISTQLEFVMIELNGAYWRVRDALLAVETVEDATRIFQNQYEKCGICKEEQRIVFAWELYHKYVQE